MKRTESTSVRDINMDKVVENWGGNRYEMIYFASQRAIQIAKKRTIADREAGRTIQYPRNPVNEALYELEQGNLK